MFEITVLWPEAMIDIGVLHHKWLDSKGEDIIQTHHPNLQVFVSALNAHRKNNNEAVSTTDRMPMLFSDENHTHAKFNLAWRENTTGMVYIDLRAAMDSCGLFKD